MLTDSWPATEPAPTSAPAWQLVAPGMEWRTITPGGDELAQMKVLRFEPRLYTFRVHYHPGEPLSLFEWRDVATDALAIVNVNFFDPEYRALGLVISDGVAQGTPYIDRGGTFLVKDDAVSIHSFRAGAIKPDDTVRQAVQGFPMLVEDGRQAYADGSNTRRTRRTVIALDSKGRVLIMVTPFLGLSLAELSAYLSGSDLDIENAMNLDGGGSTLLSVNVIDYVLPSLDKVPTILSVYER